MKSISISTATREISVKPKYIFLERLYLYEILKIKIKLF